MLRFNELRMTPDNKCLIIDTLVEDISYFDNVKIGNILLDTQDTYVATGPSNNAIELYSLDNPYRDIILDGIGRHIRIELKAPDTINPNDNNMYFIYVIADTSEAPKSSLAPCTCNKEIIMGTAVNPLNVYNILMLNVKELADTCLIPTNLINDYLKLQSVDASIRTGNYPLAIKYWKQFFTKTTARPKSYRSCGCHG